MLDFIYEQPKVTTSLIANHFDVSIPNASMKLKKLFNQGYILGEKETASSGGHEFVYRPIKRLNNLIKLFDLIRFIEL